MCAPEYTASKTAQAHVSDNYVHIISHKAALQFS